MNYSRNNRGVVFGSKCMFVVFSVNVCGTYCIGYDKTL